MRVAVLGPIEVRRDGGIVPIEGRRPRALLALLALHRGRVLSVDRIVDDLWGEDVPETAVKMVHIAVSALRRALGPEAVLTRAPGYVLDADGGQLDLDEFRRLHREGRSLVGTDPARAAVALGAALALWRGPALAEFSEPFAVIEAARLEEARLACLEDRIDADLASGSQGDLVGEVETLAVQMPLRPRLQRQLMLALYRSGRHAEALEAYQRHRAALGELGIEPSQPLRELQRRILVQDPALDLPVSRTATISPGPLLEREDAFEALGRALRFAAAGDGRLVCVTGEPGIGKTALVSQFVERLPAGAHRLVGVCDDLSTPAPLAPFRELCPTLTEAIAAGLSPHEVHSALLTELATPPSPAVLVLEDVHWADGATLDVILLLARRIQTLSSLVILTFRPGELAPGHPLHAALAAVRPDCMTMLDVPPLSPGAVASLVGDDAGQIYAATGGNPFYVTELASARPSADLPHSVANAVRGRAARLDERSRRLVELVSVVPGRMRTEVLDVVLPGWPAAAEEPERRGLLRVDRAYVKFRHELARHAIQSSLPVATTRRLHQEILSALIAADADPAEIVHHAELAEADELIAPYALLAARSAVSLGANREALAHFQRALRRTERPASRERATILEELAVTAYTLAEYERAFMAIDEARRQRIALGDREDLGRCLRRLSRLYWVTGDGDMAMARAIESVEMLEPLGESVELARSYSSMSQLAMLREDTAETEEWGHRALELATKLGAEWVRVHALINLAVVGLELDPDGGGPLVEAFRVAHAAGEHHEAGRALLSLGYSNMLWGRTTAAAEALEQAVTYGQDYEQETLGAYAQMALGALRVRTGEWDDAERVLHGVVPTGSVTRLVADTALAELAVRRGDADAADRLELLRPAVERTREFQRIAPVVELDAEHALLTGGPLPADRIERIFDEVRARRGRPGVTAVRTAAWGRVAGVEPGFPVPPSLPYAAMAAGEWRDAAHAFGQAGWDYDRALMLALDEDASGRREAHEIAERLGAAPLAAFITRRR
jgi:DNA-binding SARP family transcriptional activator/tetratricopeptide (TPR) repeat protein